MGYFVEKNKFVDDDAWLDMQYTLSACYLCLRHYYDDTLLSTGEIMLVMLKESWGKRVNFYLLFT